MSLNIESMEIFGRAWHKKKTREIEKTINSNGLLRVSGRTSLILKNFST